MIEAMEICFHGFRQVRFIQEESTLAAFIYGPSYDRADRGINVETVI